MGSASSPLLTETTTMQSLRFLLAATLLVGASALELTPATYDEAIAGKTVFIKFLAPW